MIRDTIIVAFAKLRAAGRDARADLLDAAATCSAEQYAALTREIEAVAALFAEECPSPKLLKDRTEPGERKGPMTKRERVARQRYSREFSERLASLVRAQ